METRSDFPSMPETGGRAHALESTAAMVWTLLFLAYSSSTFLSEFGTGWSASWSMFVVILPVSLAGTPAILDRRPGAVKMLVIYLAYAFIPSLIQLFKDRKNDYVMSEIADVATVLAIWFPLEMKLLSTDFSPTGKVTAWGLLTAALNIVNIFTVLCPLSDVPQARELGYSFKLSAMDLFQAFSLTIAYAGTAVPLAVAIQFARLARPKLGQPERAAAVLVGLYMNALAEELLFRGLLQNMIEQRLGQNSVLALLLSATAFGLAHLSKSKQGFEAPNFRFFAIALVSGVFCGLTWRWTGKTTASALTHSMGNFLLWHAFLRKPTEV